ncbi:hypothetical protein DPMN_005604 [Dreissena polymorpha]|uniref:Uncharacterized protein n=1 Tax=Dreissena polymorpha TaxID=45954 RepID=A0A9D4MPY5_DREPO|nr:hypothetical protein DPMN_005604 [Dreissena polymorpha]
MTVLFHSSQQFLHRPEAANDGRMIARNKVIHTVNDKCTPVTLDIISNMQWFQLLELYVKKKITLTSPSSFSSSASADSKVTTCFLRKKPSYTMNNTKSSSAFVSPSSSSSSLQSLQSLMITIPE